MVKISLTVFVVAYDAAEAKVLDVVELVEDFLDGKKFVVSVTEGAVTQKFPFTITCGASKLLGYMDGGQEVYTISAELK